MKLGGRRWSIAGLALTLAGCATPTPFQPADSSGTDGYTAIQVEQNRFRLSFNGNSLTSRQDVDSNLLYLAAEVTLKNGADWFLLTKNAADKSTSYNTVESGPAFMGGWGGPWGGWSGGMTTGYAVADDSWTESADILLQHGTKPPADPNAYDARDVAAHLTPAIRRTGRPGPF
jgi:hypothetical protein